MLHAVRRCNELEESLQIMIEDERNNNKAFPSQKKTSITDTN